MLLYSKMWKSVKCGRQ